MPAPYASQRIGSALVIGGSGFLGSHIVELLLKEAEHGPIASVSRNPQRGTCFTGASYTELDLNDTDAIRRLVSEMQPEIIFYVAAPRAIDNIGDPAIFQKSIVEGTRSILGVMKAAASVRALVYTSSCSVHAGYEHNDLTEDAPMWEENATTFPYFRAKALADKMVCAVNERASTPSSSSYKGKLLTVSLRPAMCYGERDTQSIPGQLEAYQKGQTKVQLGDGTNRVDPAYGPIVAEAHLLAAKALLAISNGKIPSEAKRVDGEAFFVTNGDPQPFWDFSRRIWRLAGDTTDAKDITKIPAWLAMALSTMVEWAFFLLTLGQKAPPLNLTRLYIGYAINNATYSIAKARDRLGFAPKVNLDRSLQSSVQSTLSRDSRFRDLKLKSI